VVIICSFTFNDEIYSDLTNNGFSPEQIIRSLAECMHFETPRTFAPHLDGYRWAYDFFEDDLSRRLVMDRMRLYLLGAPLRPNTACTMYYEDGFVPLAENEVFIDGGAYNGESVEIFIDKMRHAGKAYSRIYSFEPSPANYAVTAPRLSDCKNTEIVQKGLWSYEGELLFYEDSQAMAGASFVIGSGDGRAVPVTSLDVFFRGRSDGELPTFIKMDVEGAEKEALLGAAGIIRCKKPKLSICAYHKIEDIFELPRTIVGIRDDYRFALRQHRTGLYDTVLYAV
jgi:FkbM family methyltransferase